MREVAYVFVGFGWGAPDARTAEGPFQIQQCLKVPSSRTYYLSYHPSFADLKEEKRVPDAEMAFKHATRMVSDLANLTESLRRQGLFPIVFGGDHTIALGTWSGLRRGSDAFYLLWFDAHMDAHTRETSGSLSPHGMPVAALTGKGEKSWTHLSGICPAIEPELVVQMGIRSFEPAEPEALKNSIIFYQDDVEKNDFFEKLSRVRKNMPTPYYGVSIDIDAFDPTLAPGTGTTVGRGMKKEQIFPLIKNIIQDPYCIGLEIAEFNPQKDIQDKTKNLILDLLREAGQ